MFILCVAIRDRNILTTSCGTELAAVNDGVAPCGGAEVFEGVVSFLAGVWCVCVCVECSWCSSHIARVATRILTRDHEVF